MLKVTLPAAPAHYWANVKSPGDAFLAKNPTPSGADWHGKNYWAAIKNDLRVSYGGVCCYCSSWSPRGTDSVDHFNPKSRYPNQAYEWGNFRYCRAKLNQFKDAFEDVLDPLTIGADWFELNFINFQIRPSSLLESDQRKLIWATINRLRLNTENGLVNERSRLIYKYASGAIANGVLALKYPFIYREIVRQNFDIKFKPIIRSILAKNPHLGS